MNKPPQQTSTAYLPSRALWTGIFLILISIWAVMAEGVRLFALTPGGVGLVIASLGIVAERNPRLRRRALGAALGLALLALLGSLPGVPGSLILLRGGTLPQPVAALTQFATIFICLAFLVRGYLAWGQEQRKGR
jgi:hypothetical protein